MSKNNIPSNHPALSNEEIIAAARQLRQEENERMHIRPWKRHRHWGWAVAIPAACLVGFAFGYYLRPSADEPTEQLAKTVGRTDNVLVPETVHDTVLVREVVHDTVYQVQPVSQPLAPHRLAHKKTSQPEGQEVKAERIGVSMLEDGIRYDLLAECATRMP